ncbi:hypothetical protein [Chryseobacterium indoltheticum]|uniref:hypothetical protein n=1 Tax=Chryseobacterium indoltheticum TaxID=254 RepID=UPI003F498174
MALNETLNACQRYILMHPKGNLHIKTGILPEKSIKLPYNKIKNALKRIELTLLTTPVLTPKENLEIPLAKDKRYEWSWVELEKKNKKEPLSATNPPVKKRITQNLAIDFNKDFETETYLQSLLSDLKDNDLLVNELMAFFPNDKIYFVDKEQFEKKNEGNKDQIKLGFINDTITNLLGKEENIRSKKVAFDFNQFKTKKLIALKEFLIREGYVIHSKTNLLNNEVYFIDFSKIKILQAKQESTLNDFEKDVMNLLALKASNKVINLKEILKKLYAFIQRKCFSDH